MTSTDAILFYGYCWDDEDEQNPPSTLLSCDDDAEDSDWDRGDWQEHYVRTRGCLPPPSGRSTKYWAERRKIIDASPCLIDTHCSASCPMAFVAVRASMAVSHRGHPTEVVSVGAVDPSWNGALRAFCEELQIDVGDKRPRWWLVSDWSE